jgi:toxin ParE1/3/4
MSRLSLRLAQEAERDLEKISDWISDQNPVRARSFVKEIKASCEGLRLMPDRFPKVRPDSELRRMVHGNYLIFFRASENLVDIARILHGAMDYERILFPEDSGES